jgi:hypothetical protein
VGSAVSGAVSSVSQTVTSVASAVSGAVSNAVNTVSSAVTHVAQSVSSGVLSAARTVASTISRTYSSAKTSVSSTIKNVTTSLSSSVKNAYEYASASVEHFALSAVEAMEDTASDISARLAGSIGGLAETAKRTVSGLRVAAGNIVSGIGDSISKGSSSLKSKISNSVSSTRDLALKAAVDLSANMDVAVAKFTLGSTQLLNICTDFLSNSFAGSFSHDANVTGEGFDRGSVNGGEENTTITAEGRPEQPGAEGEHAADAGGNATYSLLPEQYYVRTQEGGVCVDPMNGSNGNKTFYDNYVPAMEGTGTGAYTGATWFYKLKSIFKDVGKLFSRKPQGTEYITDDALRNLGSVETVQIPGGKFKTTGMVLDYGGGTVSPHDAPFVVNIGRDTGISGFSEGVAIKTTGSKGELSVLKWLDEQGFKTDKIYYENVPASGAQRSQAFKYFDDMLPDGGEVHLVPRPGSNIPAVYKGSPEYKTVFNAYKKQTYQIADDLAGEVGGSVTYHGYKAEVLHPYGKYKDAFSYTVKKPSTGVKYALQGLKVAGIVLMVVGAVLDGIEIYKAHKEDEEKGGGCNFEETTGRVAGRWATGLAGAKLGAGAGAAIGAGIGAPAFGIGAGAGALIGGIIGALGGGIAGALLGDAAGGEIGKAVCDAAGTGAPEFPGGTEQVPLPSEYMVIPAMQKTPVHETIQMEMDPGTILGEMSTSEDISIVANAASSINKDITDEDIRLVVETAGDFGETVTAEDVIEIIKVASEPEESANETVTFKAVGLETYPR